MEERAEGDPWNAADNKQFAQLIASEIVSQQQLAADAAEGVRRHPSLSLSPTVGCVV